MFRCPPVRFVGPAEGLTAPPRHSVNAHREPALVNQPPEPDEPSSTPVAQLKLRPGRHHPFLARHPWVHAHSLADTGERLRVGEVVDVTSHEGRFVGRGLINPAGKLRVRLYGFDESEPIDAALWRRRLDAAISRRDALTDSHDPKAGCRWVHSEGDQLSGLVVDRYADVASVQFNAAAVFRHRQTILDYLGERPEIERVHWRIDPRTARAEGVEASQDWANGASGDDGAGVEYTANQFSWTADPAGGQKTGGYLDQRDNHAAAARWMPGRRVLDVCCYHGGFALAAIRAGADSVTAVDSSLAALEAADAATRRNGLPEIDFLKADCFDLLADLGRSGETYDAVILDPPRFAASRNQVDGALKAYRRLNTAAIRVLNPGGVLVTCSCSGRVSTDDFLGMLRDVSRTAGRDVLTAEVRGAPADHPVAVTCPETRYLKCVIATVP